jgi:hypothetical protein
LNDPTHSPNAHGSTLFSVIDQSTERADSNYLLSNPARRSASAMEPLGAGRAGPFPPAPR